MTSAPGDEDLISSSDFKSVELKISFDNTTSRTQVSKDAGVRLIEFTERGLALEVPKASCAQGHSLVIQIERVDDSDVPVLELTGKVESFVPPLAEDPTGASRADIALMQYDERAWNEFVGLFSRRQEEILAFLNSVRGY